MILAAMVLALCTDAGGGAVRCGGGGRGRLSKDASEVFGGVFCIGNDAVSGSAKTLRTGKDPVLLEALRLRLRISVWYSTPLEGKGGGCDAKEVGAASSTSAAKASD